MIHRAGDARTPGKHTLTSQIQRRRKPSAEGSEQTGREAHEIAAEGTRGGGSDLPHRETIERAFGNHDIGHVRAHVGGAAAEASDELGALAYASGDDVAFRSSPDLHTAAHEAAHVVQQRAGIQLKGGSGEDGDAYERHADAVADAVVAGRSAEALLDAVPQSSAGSSRGVQRKRSHHGEVSGEITHYKTHEDGGVRVFFSVGTNHGVELGGTVTFSNGASFEIVEADEAKSAADVDLGVDEIKSLDRRVTFAPQRRSRRQRRLERKAQVIRIAQADEVDEDTSRVLIERGRAHGFNARWKVQLLNDDGSPRLFGEVDDVGESSSWLTFPLSHRAILDSSRRVRLIPNE